MSNDELQEACARALGWSHIVPGSGCAKGYMLGTNPSGNMDKLVPEFSRALDACAQLRVSLTEEERKRYAQYLAANCHPPGKSLVWTGADASAADPCRAFLAAKGA